MGLYRTKLSETPVPPVRTVRLKDGRQIKKITDRSFMRKGGPDIRGYVQLFFLLITIWIGVDFYLFMNALVNGGPSTVTRPPGVEGFLPISALMSVRYFILTGIVNHIHPAGFFIFVAAILISVLMKKGFCSWICPVGLISESLYEFGAKLFGRNFAFPKWVDVPLRSLKYILLAFFFVSVSALSVEELGSFIHSDFNKAADIKMYMFFAQISTFSLVIIGLLIALSLFYKNFWCRYACPYGALLGIASLVSPLKIRRVKESCIDCGLCSQACPSGLPVDKLDSVSSAECNACYSCVEACPVKNTLNMSARSGRKGLSQNKYALFLFGIYFGVVGVAVLAGLWQNSITFNEYLVLFRSLGSISHAF